MAFVEIDPNSLKLDAAPASKGFIEVDPTSIQLDGDGKKPAGEEKSLLSTIGAGIKSAGAGAIGTLANVIDPTPMFGLEKVDNPIRPNLEPTKKAAAQVVDQQRAQYGDGLGSKILGYGTETLANPLNYVGGRAAEGANLAVSGGRALVQSALGGATSGYLQGVGEGDNRNVNAAVGGVAGPIVSAAGQAVQGTVKGARDIIRGVRGPSAEQWQDVGQNLKAQSQATFKAMTDSGEVIGKKEVNGIVKTLDDALQGDGVLNDKLHAGTLSVMKDIKALRNKPLSFEGAQQYRQLLSDVVESSTDAAGKVNPDGRKALVLIDKLDDAIEGLGGTGALAKQAREEWGNYRRFEKVRMLVDRFGDKPGVLKNQISMLLKSGKQSRGFSAEEKQALGQLAEKGGLEGWLRLIGRAGFDPSNPSANVLLPVVAGGVGAAADGLATGGAVTAGATAARMASKAISRGQANQALGVLAGERAADKAAVPFVSARAGGVVSKLVPSQQDQQSTPPQSPPSPRPVQPNRSPVSDTLVDKIIGVESGGRADAKNPNSSARGAGQFIKSTWLDLMKDEPEAQGKSPREILALRDDKDISRRMVTKYAEKNSAVLQKRGIETNDATIYLAHLLDAPVAARLLKASPETPALKIVGRSVVAANPSIFKGKTAGQVLAWAERKTRA
ncbi:hypothetical protein Rleg2_1153 [Rhizobium leguminosarum bv. trifolii WSM2304]|uniref:Uncharacterized protein n=1 Tax=Rhizobium leguminosarum bv. trifolii (strain WSM2304) TaxID=395492 RepID=A0ABF7QKH1_RHILW|nr:hypothetical protein [Rhizobium leguminosarum]ACI54447.1 hypothetical protein Rleg2_1153 [Rhizobium leguminosarum bv. trifolii WSM2304]